MYQLFRFSICLFALGTFISSESLAGPPHGYGGSSGSFGFSIGGSGPGISIGVGSGPSPGYYDRDYSHGRYDRDYYYGRNYGNMYGRSGVYFGSGSSDFRWGVGIPFGYDDYDWYTPYYNSYSRRYYNYGQGYYQSSDFYDENNPTLQTAPLAIEHPPVPTAGQVARLTDDQLKMMISVALDSYSKELDGFTTGAGWKKHFKLMELKERIAAMQIGALDSDARAFVGDLSKRFDVAAADPAYEVITKPWSFQTLQVALKEYSLPEVQRQAHELNAKTKTLHRSLDNISTGEGWVAYLRINELEKLLAESSKDNAELNKKLEKILERFDDVVQNPEYKSIAGLRGFDETRKSLQQHIRTLQTDTSKTKIVLPPPVESSPGEAAL